MRYVKFHGSDLSVFSLGTVQLGMDYGLGDHTAKPTRDYAFSLLDRALACGINTLDTANNYGESEQVIGQWLKTVPPDRRPYLVTKIGPFDHSSPEALLADIRSQAYACRETLGVPQLDFLMVHSYEDYEKDPELVCSAFAALKQEGILRFPAISAYSENDYTRIARSDFQAIQIPLNVFDWRQIENGGIQALADAGISIFARSVFLQGLVFMKPEELDPRMAFCRPYLEAYRMLCREWELSPSALALSFVLSTPGVTTVVLGCQTLEQVENNRMLIEQARPLTASERHTLREAFLDIDPRVLNPRCWFNHF